MICLHVVRHVADALGELECVEPLLVVGAGPVPGVVVFVDDEPGLVLELAVGRDGALKPELGYEFGEFLFESAPAVAVFGHLVEFAGFEFDVVTGVWGGGAVC